VRPDKTTVDFYPHFCEEGGKTLFILENTFGNDGYAFWFKMLSLLGRTPGHFFDAHDRHAWLFLIAKTRVSEDIANGIMALLVDLEAIDRELWERDRVIWCQKFVDHLADLYARRKGGTIPQKPSFRIQEPGKCQQEPPSAEFPTRDDDRKPQTKLNHTKPKERKAVSDAETAPDAPDPKPEKVPPVYPQEVHTLCETFRDMVIKNDPAFKVKNWPRWLEEMERLNRIDLRPFDEIARVMVFALETDQFWKANVFSVATFREKFPKIRAKMNGTGGAHATRHEKNMAAIRTVLEETAEEGEPHGRHPGRNEIAGHDGDSFAGQDDQPGVCEDLPGDHGGHSGRGVF